MIKIILIFLCLELVAIFATPYIILHFHPACAYWNEYNLNGTTTTHKVCKSR